MVAFNRTVPARWHVWIALFAASVTIGALTTIAPPVGIGVVAATAAVALAATGRGAVEVFVVGLAAVLTGYALMGRGFAYLGAYPLFVGEIALFLGVVGFLAAPSRRRFGAAQLLIVALMLWGAVRTVPYLSTYGADALRDASAWGYAAFALLISAVLTASHVRRFVRYYATLVPVLAVWLPVLAILWVTARELLPTVPGTLVTIPFFKAGDWGVHLAGVGAFLLTGLYTRQGWRRLAEPVIWALWLAGFVIVASISRGAMLAAASMGTVLLLRREPARWVVWGATAVFLVAALGATGLEVDVGGARRLSAEQLIANVESVIGDSDDPALVDSRRWREQWWDEIMSYTIAGAYFWDGKGYGINLSQADGFQSPDGTLRAPHNAHLNILARSGVPGLTLWISVQVAFAITMLHAAALARARRRRLWMPVIAWIMAYWIAALVNMTFDVYLEGPQGGIVYWSIIGFGLAVAAVVREELPPEGWLKTDPDDTDVLADRPPVRRPGTVRSAEPGEVDS